MNGYLIVNAFMKDNKFKDVYDLFLKSFSNINIKLEVKTNIDLLDILNNHQQFENKPNFVIFFDKDTYLAQRLEMLNIPVFNSSNSIRLCDNKSLTYLELSKKDITIPPTIIAPKTFEGINFNNTSFVDKAISKLGLPLIIKEAYGSFGQQVYLLNSKEEILDLIKNKIIYKDFLFQKFIKTSCGKDIRVNIVGGKIVNAIYRENKSDFRSNISNGGSAKVIKLNSKQEEIALKAFNALNLDFAGIDILFGENDLPIICEVNSNFHFYSTYKVTGVNLADYIRDYMIEKLK